MTQQAIYTTVITWNAVSYSYSTT